MRRRGVILVGLIAAVAATATPAPLRQVACLAAAENPAITPAGLTAALLAETNRVRREHGCRPLRPMRELNAAADDQATYMALTLHAAHANVLYGQATVLERVHRHGLEPAMVAENVASQPAARDAGPSACAVIAAGLVEAWMNSPGHRANLLNRDFTHLGCAARIAPGFADTEYVFGAQVFSRLRSPEWKF